MLRRRSVGLDGAESEYCDLSGRGFTTAQVERTLRVFDTAMAIDMSNNELEMIPTTIPATLMALDVSFNLIAHVRGIDRLKNLQELHLGYNRLSDVSILEFCPLLQRLNLSGNRLVHTRGIETLANLENLDLSDNLIESPEAFRALSLNVNLTHLTLRGNPIAIKSDYRVWVLDMIPSVLILDDKKIRTAVKCKSVEVSATKSLSYARIYDDKKQFMIRNTNRRTPASRPAPILVGNPNIPPKFEGNTIFLQSPTSASLMHDTIPERVRSPEPNFDCGSSTPPAPMMNQSHRRMAYQ
ncbi:hypothetical protein Poli38472_004004 [Pythium oligandrum]|uniref:Uncharacterized protein n=1 Tax=Pythium oligandrum TaxID=41045 RepID=A0A8K1FMF9_PYTOL|nr:hypothetical protein Poli38472_004004 [Pythium oligandrum]|eukprot:TMW66239.1 hypothetical protein Poli38472_004004 [Pythium oligandrum]